MPWSVLANKDKITKIIDSLVSHKIEAKVRIDDEKTIFTSRFLKTKQEFIPSKHEWRPTLIIQKLVPEHRNSLLQSSSVILLQFSINKNLCRCPVKYVGISSTNPDSRLIISFPESIEIKEKRREDRFVYEQPEFVSVLFKLPKGRKKEKVYNLNVIDCSSLGLGLLLTEKDFDLLQILSKGDKLHNMSFYTPSAVIEVNGTVVYKTKIQTGKHKGHYVIGIESREIIEYYKSLKELKSAYLW
jgi:hypothetical protein